MTEDFLERMRMADQDDDDAELKQLKQLRQVWLAMPDEEPPTRGLDALMAAARSKAEEMQPKPEPWWKRMFAAMVRPPALALATIVVVAGGAVLINRHHDELDATTSAPAMARDEQAPAPAAGSGAIAPRGGDSLGQVNGTAAVAPAAPDTQPLDKVAQPDTGAARSVGLVPPVTTVMPVAKPPAQVTHEAVAKKPRPSPAKVEAKTADDELRKDVDAPKHIVLSHQDAKPSPPPESEKPMAPKADPAPEHTEAAKSPSPPPPKPAATPPATRGPVAKGGAAQLATDNDVQNQPEAVESMLRRAREAATRGDCATAKSIATQIANRDIAFYRNTVAKDVAVAKCLPVAAD